MATVISGVIPPPAVGVVAPSALPRLSLSETAAKIGALYTLPAVAVEVLKLTGQPQVDVHQLQVCIEKDPALTGRILRVVNSSLFGLGRHVSSLQQALALLGTKPLKLLVLGFSLPSELFVGVAGDMLSRFWRRTLTKAVAARELAETIWKLPGDEPFLAGLLQNVGMLALIQELGAPYLELLDTALAKSSDIGAAETRALGFAHFELSSKMLERWGLPAPLVSAIGIGPHTETIDALDQLDRPLPQILHLADNLSSLLTESRGDLLPILMRAAVRYCGLTHAQLLALVGQLEDKVQQFADVLSLQLPGGQNYSQILIAAHEQMSVVAADAANDLIRAYRFMQSSADMEPTPQTTTQRTSGAAPKPSGESADASNGAAAPVSPPAVESAFPDAPLTLREQLWTDAATSRAGVKTTPRAPVFASQQAKAAGPIADRLPQELVTLLTDVASVCRENREPACLLLIRGQAKGLGRPVAPFDSEQPVADAVRHVCHADGLSRGAWRAIDNNLVALVLPGAERQDAVRIGNELIDLLVGRGAWHDSSTAKFQICIGLAATETPSKSLSIRDWVARAERCLTAVERTGSSGLKSIEIY